MRPLPNRIFSRVNAYVTITVCTVIGWLPLPIARRFGRGIGWIAYTFVPRVKRIGMKNLDNAYGDSLTQKEKQRILRESCDNLGINAVEFMRIKELHTPKGVHRIRLDGFEPEYLEHGKGGIIVSAHLANWEWMAHAASKVGLHVCEVVRNLHDPLLDAWVDKNRRAGVIETIGKHGAARSILRHLKQGHAVGFLIDQAYGKSAVPATFFGQMCWTTAAPAAFALRMNLPIHVCVIVRNEDDNYTIKISPRIEIERTDNQRDDIITLTQKCQDLIEGHIRENPGQWLWAHDRWKRPPAFEEKWAAETARLETAK